MATGPQHSRFLFVALYAAAVVVLLDQGAELLVSLYPFRVSDTQWRFGAFGLIMGRTTTAILVDVLVFLAAIGLGNRGLLRGWAGLHLVVGFLLVLGLGAFVLDSIELRRQTRPEMTRTFDLAAGRAAVMVLVATFYCIWAAVATFRVTRIPGRGADPVVVVKRPQ